MKDRQCSFVCKSGVRSHETETGERSSTSPQATANSRPASKNRTKPNKKEVQSMKSNIENIFKAQIKKQNKAKTHKKTNTQAKSQNIKIMKQKVVKLGNCTST